MQGWAIYQPLIVGFGAVFLGLFANSILEWFKQFLTRKNESRALRTALIAELSSNAASLHDRFKNKNEFGKRSAATVLAIPLGCNTQVYDNSIPNLGLLTEKEISSVIKSYDFLINAPKNLALLGELQGDEFYRWAKISIQFESVLRRMDEDAIKLIETAISDLSNRR